MTETGVYGFVQQTLAGKLTLNAGLRFQNHNIFGNQWIPSAGFAYALNSLTFWKGNISKGYRSPTIRELFMWGTQNPNLDPETILNYETGISKTFFKNLLKTEITIFSVSGDNLISMIPVNGILKFMNSGEISNQGIEVAIDAAPGEKFSVNATYSYIHMKNPVYATPEHHVYLSASYRLKKLQLNGNIQQIVNLDNDATPTFNPVDYITVQAKAAYHFTNYLHLFVSADNLFNQKYEVNRFYTMPGATLFTGINFRF